MENELNYFQQESERLVYRKLKLDDIPKWEAFFVDNDRLHFLGIDTSKSHAVLAKEWIEKQLERYENEGTGLLAVIEKSSGELIGMCGILQRTLDDKKAFEIGYSFMASHRKKGYATEAANQMRKFGFASNLAKQFISIIHKDNLDSMAVAVKNKMSKHQETTFLGMEVYVYATD